MYIQYGERKFSDREYEVRRMNKAYLFGSAALLILLIAVAYMSTTQEGGEGGGVCPVNRPVVGPSADVKPPPNKRERPSGFYDDLNDSKKRLTYDETGEEKQRRIFADVAKEAAAEARARNTKEMTATEEVVKIPSGKTLAHIGLYRPPAQGPFLKTAAEIFVAPDDRVRGVDDAVIQVRKALETVTDRAVTQQVKTAVIAAVEKGPLEREVALRKALETVDDPAVIQKVKTTVSAALQSVKDSPIRVGPDRDLQAFRDVKPLELTPELKAHVAEIIPPTPARGGPQPPNPLIQSACGTPPNPARFDFLKNVRSDPRPLNRKLADVDFLEEVLRTPRAKGLSTPAGDDFSKYFLNNTEGKDDDWLNFLDAVEIATEAEIDLWQSNKGEGRVSDEFAAVLSTIKDRRSVSDILKTPNFRPLSEILKTPDSSLIKRLRY